MDLSLTRVGFTGGKWRGGHCLGGKQAIFSCLEFAG